MGLDTVPGGEALTISVPEGRIIRKEKGKKDTLKKILVTVKKYGFEGYVKILISSNSTAYLISEKGEITHAFRVENDEIVTEGSKALKEVLRLLGMSEVKMEIHKAGERYVLRGRFTGSAQVVCDRCLVTFHKDMDSEFVVFLALHSENEDGSEVELLEDDMEVGFIEGEETDLDEIIHEQVYLSLPIKSLCMDDCKGLCPVCGGNLNRQDCRCVKEQGHPGFMKLKAFAKLFQFMK